MVFLLKIALRIGVNGALLRYLPLFFSGFDFSGGFTALVISALVITALSIFVKPILAFITLPLRFLTLGLFTIVIHVFILWVADFFLTPLTINGFGTLLVTSLIFAVVNTIF